MLRGKKATLTLYVGYALVVCLSFFPAEGLGLYDGCSLCSRLAYPFLHANIFHALCNLFVLHQCLRTPHISWWSLLAGYLIAVSYPFPSDIPILGLSGIVYACFGFIAPYAGNKRRFHLIVGLMLLLSLIIPNMAFGIHAYCYAMGLVWGYLNAPLCKDK